MQTASLLSIEEWSTSSNVEVSFIHALEDSGLIEITRIEQTAFVPIDRLRELEQLSRLYYDLGINLEGIETLVHLLQRVQSMQAEIITLRNRLGLYESI